MKMLRLGTSFILASLSALAACSSPPNGVISLRQTIAEALTPGASQTNVHVAYQYDMIHLQSGYPATQVSEVTIFNGKVNVAPQSVPPDWRVSGDVPTFTVAECEQKAVTFRRRENPAQEGIALYFVRLNNVLYVQTIPTAGCSISVDAVAYPSQGTFVLNINNRLIDATMRAEPWGSFIGAYVPYVTDTGVPYFPPLTSRTPIYP